MEKLSPEQIVRMKNLLKEMDINPTNQSLIQENKIYFAFKGKYYRCRMPNQKEQVDAENEQDRTKITLLQKEGTITRKKLIELLKEKQDIDIEELEKKKDELKDKLHDAYLDLASLTDDEEEKIEKARAKKNEIEEKYMRVFVEIVEHLSPCIEEKSKTAYYKYLGYTCTEKSVLGDRSGEENWEKAWDSFESFENDDTGLPIRAIDSIQTLLVNVRE